MSGRLLKYLAKAPIAVRCTPHLAVLLVCATCGPRHDVHIEFCTALQQEQRPALRDAVDAFLDGTPSGDPLAARLERLRQWIAEQPCVASAELDPVLLDTDPAVQQIRIRLEGKEAARRTIGIVLDPSRPRFNLR